jgi:K+-sensing histidine kinase KdpD
MVEFGLVYLVGVVVTSIIAGAIPAIIFCRIYYGPIFNRWI